MVFAKREEKGNKVAWMRIRKLENYITRWWNKILKEFLRLCFTGKTLYHSLDLITCKSCIWLEGNKLKLINIQNADLSKSSVYVDRHIFSTLQRI